MSEIAVPVAGLSILLVDDESLVRVGVAMLLEELNHRVIQASRADEAIKLLGKDEAFDLLMTDFRMPDMNGMELIMKAKTMRPTIRTILMTGYDADDNRFDGLDTPRLAKPFGIDALEIALGQIG